MTKTFKSASVLHDEVVQRQTLSHIAGGNAKEYNLFGGKFVNTYENYICAFILGPSNFSSRISPEGKHYSDGKFLKISLMLITALKFL